MGKQSKTQEALQRKQYMEELRKKEQEKQKQQNKLMWQIISIVVAIVVILTAVTLALQFGGKSDDENEDPLVDPEQAASAPKMEDLDMSAVAIEKCIETEDVTDLVKMNITYTDKNGIQKNGDVIVRLYDEVAPKTVKNFQDLVKADFYDGLTFHRIMEGFMIQGGDPNGDGSGDAAVTIQGEFNENGFQNNLKHERGVISMARNSYSNDSASCQFFIMHQTTTSLNGSYASFGYVVYGMDTVDAIAQTQVTTNYNSGETSVPVNPVTINYMTFVTVGE